MDTLLKGQFYLWQDLTPGKDDEALTQAGDEMEAMIGNSRAGLALEAKINEYASLIEERAFCAGFAWAVSLNRQAADFLQQRLKPEAVPSTGGMA